MEQSRGLFSFPTGKTVSFRRAFATQYIAIILIVLTFVIGTFARSKMAVKHNAPQPVQEVAVTPPTLPVPKNPPSQFVGVINVKNVFERGADILQPDMLGGLILVLKNNDLNARIDVYTEAEDAGDAGFQLAVSRTISLQKYLNGEGIDSKNFKVFASPKIGDGSQRVALYRDKTYPWNVNRRQQ